MSTHRGLATSNGKSLVIISPSGNWLAPARQPDRHRRTDDNQGRIGAARQASKAQAGGASETRQWQSAKYSSHERTLARAAQAGARELTWPKVSAFQGLASDVRYHTFDASPGVIPRPLVLLAAVDTQITTYAGSATIRRRNHPIYM